MPINLVENNTAIAAQIIEYNKLILERNRLLKFAKKESFSDKDIKALSEKYATTYKEVVEQIHETNSSSKSSKSSPSFPPFFFTES